MKQLKLNSHTQKALIIVLITISVLTIWFVGPLLVVAHQHPLIQPEKRAYIIALIFIGWLLKHLLFPPANPNAIVIPKTPEATSKLQALNGRVQGAIRFLKKTLISKQGKEISLARLPWYLFIGPKGAGKTSMLANANVNYILTKQFKQEKTSDLCDWWVTRDLVMVDVPGHYLAENENYLWGSLLNLIQKFRSGHVLKTIVIALPLPELMRYPNPPLKKRILVDVKRAILQLRKQFGDQLNFYFVITKCDLLPGFLDFFNESSAEELSQAWGITLPIPKANEKLLDIYTQRFNVLIKRLNSQLIWRLHQERNVHSRPAIKDFPLQVERLKDNLGHFLKALNLPDLRLHGIFLESALQTPSEESVQAQIINPSSHQALQLLRSPAAPSKAHFIRQLILQGLLSTAELPPPPAISQPRWHRNLAYAASIITIVTAAGLLGRDFQQSVAQTYAIQNSLAQYKLAIQDPDKEGAHLLKALPLLNALKISALQKHNRLSRIDIILSFYSDKSQKTASSVYQQALQTVVLPEIKNCFEDYLKHNNGKNPTQDYAVLKAYLMLGDSQHLQPDYVITLLTQLLPSSSANKTLDPELVKHIHLGFDQQSKPMELNTEVISKTRNQLRSLSSQDLALVILKNMNKYDETKSINLGANPESPSIFVGKQSVVQIPELFTANWYNRILDQDLPTAASQALQGNDVIGTSEILSNEATVSDLTLQLRSSYIADYANTWENLLANLKLITPANLKETDDIVASLMGNTSPLLKLLHAIKENTSFPTVVSASPKLQALNYLLANAHNDQENTLYQIFVNLRQLHFYLQNIVSSNDEGQAAFEAAKNHMSNANDPISQIHTLAEQNPEPMRTWLNALATQSWFYVLQEASHHIDNAWQLNVITIYRSQIATENQDMDISQFVGFVGKQGTLATFYLNYLKPFVNDGSKQWQWKVVDNQKLPFPNSVLQQLQHASKMQNFSKYALFTKGHQMRRFSLPEKLIEKS